MGCASSKRIEATMVSDVYRPAPTSFTVFDISTIEEPWLKVDDQHEEQQEKVVHVPAPILEKLDKFELTPDGPHSWSEVSKVLEDLKPTFETQTSPVSKPKPEHSPVQDSTPIQTPPIHKNLSFHTLEELETKLSSKSTQLKKPELKRPELKKPELKKTESQLGVVKSSDSEVVVKPVRENLFIVKDRLERERSGKLSNLEKRIGVKSKRNPLSEYPEKCPPGGADSIVLYTTTLRGVRRTFEDCNRARTITEMYRVVIDERDVSLHGGFLNELRELIGEGASVPRLFVKGRYIGGVDEVVELNELGRLSELINSVGIEKGIGKVCEGCGGARFVPCLECGGSCKVVIGDKKERCSKCNENGLLLCPLCH